MVVGLVPLSHEDLLLVILMDGRWHSLHEILRRHPMMCHSRAAGLRAKGYDIQHRCVGKGSTGSEYRLGSLSGRAETRAGAGGRAGSPAEPFLPMGQTHERGTPARPLSDRPLSEPGGHLRPGALTAGSPGVPAPGGHDRTAPGSLSGRLPDAAGCDPHNAAPAAHFAAPQESMAGQLSLEVAA